MCRARAIYDAATMIQWKDAAILLISLRLTTFGLCILLGALVWETITGLRLDWALVTGKHRFSAAYVPYAASRVLGVASLVASITASTSAQEKINCSAWALTTYICAYLAILAADAISLLRTVAISGQNKWVVRITASYYVGMSVFMLYAKSSQGCGLPGFRTL